MPSGREYHTTKMFIVPALDEDALIRMRAPPDPSEEEAAGVEGKLLLLGVGAES